MRTSLHELERIEQFIHGLGDQGDRLVLQAKAQLDSELTANITAQRETYELIKTYGRQKIREEIMVLDTKLFVVNQHSNFLRKILSYFK